MYVDALAKAQNSQHQLGAAADYARRSIAHATTPELAVQLTIETLAFLENIAVRATQPMRGKTAPDRGEDAA